MCNSPFRTLRPRAAALACLLLFAPSITSPARAQVPELSLEDLMQVTVEPVFGASRRLQPVTEAPASVTIVTAEDIARHGYRTLADVLSGVRGFYVTSDRNYSYLGARGFALPGDYNSRILLLVDGHRVNDPIYQQAPIGNDLGMDVYAFERVEIVRGPASSLYGTSAFFAVVNVITKTGASLNGVSLNVEGGSFGTEFVRAAAGRKLGNGLDVALVASAGMSDGIGSLFYPEFDAPDTNNGFADGLDGEDFRQLFGRVSFKDLTITGLAATRDKGVPTAAYDTLFGDPRFQTTDARAYLDARYDRAFGRTRVSVQTFVDRYRYDGVYPYLAESEAEEPGSILFSDFSEGRWWGAEGRVSREFTSRHTVTVGTEFRDNIREIQGGEYEGDPESAFLASESSRVLSAYGQDEIRLSDHLLVTAGARYDSHAGFSRVTPRIAVVAKSSNDQAFKYLHGNAFRAPNAYELDYYSHPFRRIDLKPETITSHELVWERYSGRWLRTSTSAFYNTLADLIGFFSTDNGEYGFENRGRVRARGLEFEAEARHRSGLRGLASYVLQDAGDEDSGEALSNSPRHAAKLLVSATGPAESTFAVDLQYLSARLGVDGTSTGSVALAAVSGRVPLSRGLTLSGSIRNLFDRAYADPGSAEHRQNAIMQDGRSFRIGLEWHVGSK